MIINTTPRAIVPASLYGVASLTAVSDLNQIAAYMHVFNSHQLSRVRRGHTSLGTPIVAKKVKIWCGNITAVTSIKVATWRWTGTTYVRTWISENIRAFCTANQVNEVTLTSLTSGFAEGHYTSLEAVAPGTITNAWGAPAAAQVNGLSSANLRYVTVDPGSTFNWDAADALSGRYLQIQIMVDSAPFAFTGDSHVAGAYEHAGYAKAREISLDHQGDDVDGTWQHQFRLLSGYDYDNLGIGGEESDDTAADARIAALLAAKTRYVVILTGWNNIRNGGVDKAAYLFDINKICDALIADGQMPILAEWNPLTGETNAHHVLADEWLASARQIGKGLWMPLRVRTGKARSGGTPTPPAGNLWDFKTGYAAVDNIHPNNACKVQMAEALWDLIGAIQNPGRTVRIFNRDGETYIKRGYFDGETPTPMHVELANDDGTLDTSIAGKQLVAKLSIDEATEATVPVINNNDGTFDLIWPADVSPFTLTGTKRYAKARIDTLSSDGAYTEYLPRFAFPIRKRV